jgi:hypothetical protein
MRTVAPHMNLHFYHLTTPERAAAILVDGFRDEDNPFAAQAGGDSWRCVWVTLGAPYRGFVTKDPRRTLLEVLLDVSDDELADFAVPAMAEEVWDDEGGRFVRVEDEHLVERFLWYKIPAAVLNSRGHLRYVPPEEVTGLAYETDE